MCACMRACLVMYVVVCLRVTCSLSSCLVLLSDGRVVLELQVPINDATIIMI